MRKRIALVVPEGLPVPAVRGGAIEELVTILIEQNEIVVSSALNDLNERISNLSEVNASDVNNLNDKISNLSDIIEQNEPET